MGGKTAAWLASCFPWIGRGRLFMLGQKLSALHELLDDQLKEIDKRKPSLTCFQELKDMEEESLHWKEEDTAGGKWIKMPFLHHMIPDIQFKWDLSDFDPARPNDVPDINLAVLGLVLATNIEISEGTHAWSRIKYSLERMGFTNFMHHYFEKEEKVNHPAMAFARSAETVKGKYVVAAVYRGSMSYRDFISDMGAETDGFYKCRDSFHRRIESLLQLPEADKREYHPFYYRP